MASDLEEKNKALVLRAFDTLFNKRDYPTAEQFWSPQYIQHSAHIAPGRQGLFDLIKSLPPTLKYEAGTIVAEGCTRPRARHASSAWVRQAGRSACSRNPHPDSERTAQTPTSNGDTRRAIA